MIMKPLTEKGIDLTGLEDALRELEVAIKAGDAAEMRATTVIVRTKLQCYRGVYQSAGQYGAAFLSSLLFDALLFTQLSKGQSLRPIRLGVETLQQGLVSQQDFIAVRRSLIAHGFEFSRPSNDSHR